MQPFSSQKCRDGVGVARVVHAHAAGEVGRCVETHLEGEFGCESTQQREDQLARNKV